MWLVVSFTDNSFSLLMISWKARCSIIRNFRDLCGIAAMGDIFSFAGGLFLMSSHRSNRQCPSRTFSSISFLHAVVASGLLADLQGPYCIAACRRSVDQFFPQSTGHPVVAYCSSSAAASWLRARFRGIICPTNVFVPL